MKIEIIATRTMRDFARLLVEEPELEFLLFPLNIEYFITRRWTFGKTRAHERPRIMQMRNRMTASALRVFSSPIGPVALRAVCMEK